MQSTSPVNTGAPLPLLPVLGRKGDSAHNVSGARTARQHAGRDPRGQAADRQAQGSGPRGQRAPRPAHFNQKPRGGGPVPLSSQPDGLNRTAVCSMGVSPREVLGSSRPAVSFRQAHEHPLNQTRDSLQLQDRQGLNDAPVSRTGPQGLVPKMSGEREGLIRSGSPPTPS